MRTAIATVAATLSLAPGLCWAVVEEAGTSAPVRVLFCIADDASPHFGAYGCTWAKTPAIDRLAQEGITFDRAYTPTAKCSPARAAILTGRYPWQLEAAANHNPFFPPNSMAFTEALADAGVAVGAAGKFWSPGVAQTADGADRTWGIGPPGLARSGEAASSYREFLAGLPPDKPAFFWFGSTNPHRPYARDAGLAAGKQLTDIDRVPAYWPDDEIVRRDMLDYATRIEAFDAEIAALLDVLDTSGQAKNTIVIVTSDHGMPFPRVKGHCFEAAHRVPLVVRLPAGGREAGGRRVNDFVNFVDLAPTFLELFGIAAETSGMRPITGRSIVDLFEDRPVAGPPRDATFIGRERNDVNGRAGTPSGLGYPARGIREGNHLYVKNFAPDRWPCCDPDLGLTDTDPGPTKQFIAVAGQLDRFWNRCFGLRPAEELYDVEKDPDCLKNLAGDAAHVTVRSRLAERLMAALREQEDPRVLGKGDVFDQYPAPPSAKNRRAKGADSGRTRDVVIYGGTSAAVIAAIRAALLGADVVIVSPDRHVGGLTSGGLGYTDSGNTRAIGGLAREFYRRVWKHYQQPEAWKWQPRDTFRGLGQGVKQADTADDSMWLFEPHVAERIFDEWLAEHEIEVVRDVRLDREHGVELVPAADGAAGPRIRAITMLAGPAGQARRFAGKVFIDATYEGDLMAAAGVRFHVGREANAVYGEEWNGNQVGILHHSHFFKVPVDPFKTPGDPQSGLIPLISADPPGTRGEGDKRVQAYCFRMCLTDHPDNRVPFAKPPGYDPARYEVLARVLAAGWRDVFNKFDAIPNRKTDTNNHGPVSFDHIGANEDYPEASYERRREIIADHERYQRGMLYFLAHDERVPADIRTRMRQWGLPKDEYDDNDHWSPQLYIREARRMIGADVLTEHECLGKREVKKPVGMGSYNLDSHNVRRYVTPEGTVQNEGDIQHRPPGPYHIGYGSLVPKRDECANLLVPVCLSASHIAYGSARMEPVFMLLGDAAANAAVLAARSGSAVQDVDYASLRGLLEAQGQVLEIKGTQQPATRESSTPRRPSVLVILGDDQRADTIHALGNEVICTPAIDSLVARGTAFTRAYCMGSMVPAVCVASRAMLLSGRSLFHADTKLGSCDTWPERFERAGYRTFVTGKWHNGVESLRRCFAEGDAVFLGGMHDQWSVPTQSFRNHGEPVADERHTIHSSELFGRAAERFAERLGDEPFFALVSFTAPHDPRQAPDAFRARWQGREPPLPTNFLPEHPFDNGELQIRDELLLPRPRIRADIAHALADYYACVETMDDRIGRILSVLEAKGRLSDTIVLFTSDHGLALGSHGLLGKQNLYEHSMRSPAILAGPGVPAGSRVGALAYLFDLTATVGDLCGVAPPEGNEGRSLAAVMRGHEQDVRESLLLAYKDVQRALVTDGWKLIDYPQAGRVQLFDLAADAAEQHDRSGVAEEAQRLAALRDQLAAALVQARSFSPATTRE